ERVWQASKGEPAHPYRRPAWTRLAIWAGSTAELPGRGESVPAHRCRAPLDQRRLDASHVRWSRERRVRGLAQHRLARFCPLLKPLRKVDRIAHDRVLEPFLRA